MNQPQLALATRPPAGHAGRQVQVQSNTFVTRRRVSPLPAIWCQLAVKITKSQARDPTASISKPLARSLWQVMERDINTDTNHRFYKQTIVYDGRSIAYAPNDLGLAMKESVDIPVRFTRRDGQDPEVMSAANDFIINLEHVADVDPNFAFAHVDNDPHFEWNSTEGIRQRSMAIVAINVVMMHSARMNYDSSARSFFLQQVPPNAAQNMRVRHDVGAGVKLLRGFTNAVRPTLSKDGMFVSMDATSGAYVAPGNLLDFVAGLAGVQPHGFRAYLLQPRELLLINRYLRAPANKLVIIYHPPGGSRPKRYRVKGAGLTPESVSQIFFKSRTTNDKKTIAEYFRDEHNINLRPDLPCVDVGGLIEGAKLPLQLCSIEEGARYSRRLTNQQQQRATDFQQLKPAERFQLIHNIQSRVLPPHRDPFLNAFGLAVDTAMRDINARVLSSADVQYGGGRAVNVGPGSWRMGRGDRFVENAIMPRNCALFEITDRRGAQPHPDQMRHAVLGLLDNITSVTGFDTSGVIIKYFQQIPAQEADEYNCRIEILKAVDNIKPEFIFVVIPRKGAVEYEYFKAACDSCGIVSQAIARNNLERKGRDPQFAANMALKLNAKLGGINFQPPPDDIKSILGKQAIVFGIDSTHSATGRDDLKPSIAAMVATVDASYSRFEWAVRANKLKEPPAGNPKAHARKSEIIEGFGDMVLEVLQRILRLRLKCPPPCLVFFRDAVSESEYDKVLNEEIAKIFWAVEQLKNIAGANTLSVDGNPFEVHPTVTAKLQTWEPEVIFIVCGKRHNLRFATNRQGRLDNVAAGTVIDSEVVDPWTYDFYLSSHQGRLGTSRSAHYTVLTDGTNTNNSDRMQELCNRFATLYSRSQTAISIVAPIRHASLLCARAKLWVRSIDGSTGVSMRSGSSTGNSETRRQDLNQYEDKIRDTVYALRHTRSDNYRGQPAQCCQFWA